LSHRAIIRALRNFEGANIQYRVIQERYREKVRARVHAMQSLAAPERYAQLKAAQPWVLDLAKEEDVANYLGVTVKMLRGLFPPAAPPHLSAEIGVFLVSFINSQSLYHGTKKIP